MTIECGVLDEMRAINLIPRDEVSRVCLKCRRNMDPQKCPFFRAIEKLDKEHSNDSED